MAMRNGLALLLVFGVLGTSAQSRAAEQADESRIETKLKKDADLRDVKVKYERTVILTGKVASESDKARAGRLASVGAGTKVDNQIEVDTERAKDRTKDKIEDRAEAAKEKAQTRADIEKTRIDRAAEAAKEKVDRKDSAGKTGTSTGDELSDAWVTTKLKSQYTTESAFRESSIHVDTDSNGQVTLRGTVPSREAHTKALEVARSTKGVRDVKDELKVGPSK
jgi:hyperosmotically inducible periplasmic protein